MIKIHKYRETGYHGGKESPGTFQKIINEIRPHDIFISGFLGNCAVMRAKKPANLNAGFDLDTLVIEAWKEMQLLGHEFYNISFLQVIKNMIKSEIEEDIKYCIYLDPPYIMESRKSNKKVYRYEMDTSQHEELLSLVKSLSIHKNIDIVISHYPNGLYDYELKDWRKINFQSQTRQGPAVENLYMNYEHETGELHQYDFVGDNKDERYNLKSRLSKNLIEKLKRMEPRKRQAVLYYIKKSLTDL